VQAALWVWVAITTVGTVYLGWHYFVDDIAGFAMGAVALLLARAFTGIDLRAERERRRRERAPHEGHGWDAGAQPAGASARSH
jgi:membrane-associated phospholipid phosphatase